MICPVMHHGGFKEKGRALCKHPPGKEMALEHEPNAHTSAEGLLEEIAIHSGCRVRLLEVI
jgi:hypothetical protein